MVNKTNLGSFTMLPKTADWHFLYAFVALNASIRGWKYCMPAVVVDGTSLKSSYAGTILCATVLDAAGKILPLAYAIVDYENDASWDWFFRKLKQAYGERENMYIVYDRHDSILKATSNVNPDVPHYNCIYHLWNNIKRRFKKHHERLRLIFFAMANAYTRADFNRLMEDTDNVDDKVRGYLYDIGYEKWSIAHSTVNRSMVTTLNIAKSLNSATRHARDPPINNLLEFMMNLVMRWNNDNRKDAIATFSELGNKYNIIMKENIILSDKMTVMTSTDYVYSVMDAEKSNIVCMREKKCSCQRFQIDWISCPHAMATYEMPVNSIPDESA
ncbi:uncharacterized protein LOC132613017 [Lycium barbarum]|uniref:uncharacterized protein LOC132613017 n=1 Tax=Lycium barbarum TaxID=112863 RepID=UPI00293EEDC1|nr:uncharacterized protein LOC132613017 [Lycium barbarum]